MSKFSAVGMCPTEDAPAATAQTHEVELDQDLMQLNVGDFVGILTHHMGDGKVHWTLGTVESPPYLQDVEIRLWEKQRTEYYNEDDVPATEETEALVNRIAQVKGELQTSIEQADQLTAQLRERRASIMQQMEEADEYVAESKAVMHAARDDVDNIPDRHWRELKSYRIPPKMVLVVLRAVMLLLSEDEACTWPQMQRILRDFNFKARVTGYDPEQQLSPERREYILQECVSKKSFRYDRAMQGSVAIGPIYYWVLAQLDVGEAQSQKSRVNQEMVARQKELRQVLKDINDQQQRITEYQELMDDLDDQLRLCHQAANLSPSRSAASASRSRMRGTEAGRYYDSFAYAEGKEYLKPAFYPWKPTDRVIIVLRRNVVCNFDGVTTQEREEGYNLSEPQVRVLDEALLRRQAELERIGEEENVDMFQKDAAAGDRRTDRDILADRERAAAQGKPTPMASPSEDIANRIRGAEAKDSLTRRFEGKSWHRILDRKRMAIMNTFTEESAEALDVPEYYVSVTDLTAGGLNVDFDVQHDGSRTKEELQGRVNACGYPKLMALYEEEEEALAAEDGQGPEHQMKFGGERWADILPRERQQVIDSFVKDTQAATNVPAEDIKVMDVRVEEDGLTVDYSIANRQITAEEVQDLVDRFEYPEVWSLYQRLSEMPEGSGPVHQVRFRGERWASLLEESGDAIRIAFLNDTAKALETSPDQIRAETMHYDRGLIVPYTVTDCAFNDDDMDQRVEDFKYPETWALYDRLLAAAAGAAYQRAFQGPYWEAVLSEARPQLTEAFRDDSARALAVPVKQVEACSLDTDNDRLLVSFNVVTDTQEPMTVRETTQEYEYPKVWTLYGQVVEEQEAATSNMNRRFDGDLWSHLVQEKEPAIKSGFERDAKAALGTNAEQVKVLGVSANDKDMDVNFSVEGDSLLEYDVRQALEDENAFPSVWKLYNDARASGIKPLSSGSRGETAVLERVFEGDDWDLLLDDCQEDANGAFRQDAANALETSPSKIRVASAKIGSRVNYQVLDPKLEDNEVAEKINSYDFPELTGMYRRRLHAKADGEDGARGVNAANAADEADGLEGAELEELGDAAAGKKEFVGDLWEEVYADKKEDLERAFKEDTADALELADPEDVQVTKVKTSKDGIVYNYKVNNVDMSSEEVTDTLEEYPYPAMWELYSFEDAGAGAARALAESASADAANTAPRDTTRAVPAEAVGDDVVTSHQVGFDGDDWQYVLDNHRAALEKAFVSCTAELFGLEEDHVMNTVYSIGSLLVDFELKHSASISEEHVNQKLNECGYEPVWDLYGEHPYDPNEVMRTEHEVGFEGAGWSGVLRESEEELREAFVADTAEALGIPQEDCEKLTMEYVEESLLAKIVVLHSVLQDQEMIQQQLSGHPYDRVWDMYEEGSETGLVETTHQVGFDGEDWKYVVEKRPDELRDAFVTSTAALFGVDEANVENTRFTCEKTALLVDFDLKHTETMTEDEVNEKLATCEYEAVWDLYGEHPLDPSDGNVTNHEVGFEGEEWDKVLEFESDKLHEAVVLDTADALGVERDDVQTTDMKFVDSALVVDLSVRHPTLQDQELIQQQLTGYPYDRVWAVYEEGPVSEAAMQAAAAEAAAAQAEEEAAGQAQAREATPAALTANHRGETAVLEHTFEGDGWDLVLDQYPEDLNDAFKRDVAKCLDTSPSNVRVVSAEIGSRSLIVRHQVIEPELEDDEIAEAVNSNEFDEVMGLYRRHVRATEDGENAAAEEEDIGKAEWEELGDERDATAENAARAVVAPAAEDEEMDNESWTELHDVSAEGRFEKTFPGDNWENCVNENREGVADAIRKDVSDCLAADPESVKVRTIKPSDEGVKISYDVDELPAGMSGEDAQAKSDAYDYPALWAMYHEADGRVTTAHAVRFEAEGWDYIVRRHRWNLTRALSEDAGEAVDIDPDAAVDMQMVVSPEALDVTVQLLHDQSLTIEEIDEKLTACPFTRVWALYENLAPSAAMTKTFQGSAWGPVVESKREAVENAFATDAAKATDVSRLEVEVEDVQADDDKLTVAYVVRGSKLDDNEVAQRAENYPFPSVWALYEGEDGLQHPGASAQKSFNGPAWGEVLNDNRSKIEDAFKQDTAAATSTAKDQVDVTSVYATEEGLVVNYKVTPEPGRESEMPTQEEIAQRTDAYDYPAVWNLYEESNRARGLEEDERESGELRRVFDGDDWDLVLERCPEDANECFKKGVSDVLGVPAHKVTVLNAQVGSLVMDYKVRGYAGDDEEINQKVADAEFPELWALYRARMRAGGEDAPPLPEGWNQTTHQAGFDGEDWAYVVKTNPENLIDAFQNDAAKCLGLEHPSHVCRVNPSIDGQLAVDFEVQHPAETTEAQIDEKLRSCPFERVWALYGSHPYEPTNKVTTSHSIGFEGEDWDYVLEKKHGEVVKAFKVGTGNALTVPESDVVNVEVEKAEDGIVLTCQVHHAPEREEEALQADLQNYAYEEMWALYEVRPYDDENKISTLHQIDFEGDAWYVVCELQNEELRRALIQDTAAAMDVEEKDVTVVETKPDTGRMAVRLRVAHSPLLDIELIEEMVQKYGYENVWALYDTTVESEVVVKDFAGEGWTNIVANRERELDLAFVDDSGDMLSLPPRFVKVQDITTNDHGMTVAFTTFGDWFDADEVRRRAETYPYPQVWKLYNPDETATASRDVDAMAAAPVAAPTEPADMYHKTFDGKHWATVLAEKQEAVEEAFKKDTLAHAPVGEEDLAIISANATDADGLVINFNARGIDADPEQVKKAVEACEYPSVWALYEEGFTGIVETKHSVTFEGEAWGWIMDRKAAPVHIALQEDTAEALEVKKDDVTDIETHLEAEGLVAIVTVRHSPLQDEDVITEEMNKYEFPRTWAYYCPPDESPAGVKHFSGDWQHTVDEREAALKAAFTKDVSEAINTPAEDIEVERLEADAEGMGVGYKVHFTEDLEEDLESALANYPFPNVWALYQPTTDKQGVTEFSTTPHRKMFLGNDWDEVVKNNRAPLEEAFKKDTAEAMKASPEDVTVTSVYTTPEGLVANYRVANAGVPEEDVDDVAATHEYPAVWNLYEESNRARGLEEAVNAPEWEELGDEQPTAAVAREAAMELKPYTQHNASFDGEDWDYVLANKSDAVRDAIRTDAAEATGRPVEDVEDITTTLKGPIMEAQVRMTRKEENDEEVLGEAMRSCQYPRTWALYEEGAQDKADEGLARTKHTFTLEGEDWAYVVKDNMPKVTEAFKADTAEAVGCEPRHVQDLRVTAGDSGATMTFMLAHPTELAADAADEKMKQAPYNRVWALYGPRPSDPNDMVTENHDVGFEGEDWDYVYASKKAQVHEAFTAGVAEALRVDPANVKNIKMEKAPDGIVLSADVTHHTLQGADLIRKELRAHTFPELWELYEPRPYDPKNTVDTKHSMTFEGEAWDWIMKRKAREVHLAIQNDTAESLTVDRDYVRDVQTSVEPASLVAVVTVRHSPLQDEDVITEEMNRYEFPRTWAYYCPPDESPAGVKHFDGKWDEIVADKTEAVKAAFAKDTARAVSVEDADVEVQDIESTPEGMNVAYKVHFTQATNEEVTAQTDNYPFPNVWALYQPTTDKQGVTEFSTTPHRKMFLGNDWDEVVKNNRAPLEEAFKKDTAAAMEASPEDVTVTSVYTTPEGLAANYRVANAGVPEEDVDDVAAKHEYPAVWALYEARMRAGGEEDVNAPEWEELGDEQPAAAVARDLAVRDRYTDLSVSFEGEDWDYVVEKKAPALTEAFKGATANALSLEAEDIAVTEFVLGNFLVQFRVHHPSTMVESEMREKIDSYPYEEVWALYEERPRSTVVTQHDVGFEADGWEDIVIVREEEIKAAFVAATASACQLDAGAVRNPEITTYPSMMKISCTVAHAPAVQADAINTHINRYPYNEVWALYEEVPLGEESGVLTKKFDGDDWDQSLEMERAALEQAFISDTMQCLRVPRGAVSVKRMDVGSLLVDYTVRTANMNDEDIATRVESYPYPEVWALYRPRQKSREGPLSQLRQFNGRSWNTVATQKRVELKQAFVDDTAEMLDAPKENVEVTSMYTTEGALVVNYKANKDGVADDEVHRCIHDGDYPRVWKLYKEYSDEGFVHTPHSSAFPGEDWDYVLERNRRAVEENFTMCTAQALGLQSRHVTKLELSASKGEGLHAHYDINHPKDMSENTINQTLRGAEYKPLWELYETRPYDPSVVVVTSHEVAFEGESWGYTLEQKRELVEKMFLEETAAALEVEPSALRGLRTEVSPSSVTMGINVEHSPLQDDELVQTALRDHPYTKLWDLYMIRPYDPNLDDVASSHRIGFEGDRWREVMKARRADVVQAVRADAADALEMPAERMDDVATDVSKMMMVAVITVRHPEGLSNDEVQQMLSEFDYPRTWALYDEVTNPHVDVMKSRNESMTRAPPVRTGRMSELMTKYFDGIDWDLAMSLHPEAIHDAFIVDTSDVLQCPASDIEIAGMALGSLIVQYRVMDLQMPERKATNLADNYAYPHVWALYRSRMDGEPGFTSARPSYRGAPSQPALSQISTARRAAREPAPDTAADEEEARTRREAEEAQKAAKEADRREEEAKKAAEEAEKRRRTEEEAAAKEEEEARQAMERAKQRREAAQKAADDARAEEERRAREALEEKQRALEAAQRAEEAAQEARRRRVQPLSKEDAEEEEDSITYLRKALHQARHERDEYQDMVDRLQESQPRASGAAPASTASASRAAPAPAEPNDNAEDEL